MSDVENTLVNLVMNAFSAMPQGGSLSIRTQVRTITEEEARESQLQYYDAPYVVCSVIDTGEGISETVMERLYEPFFTTKGDEGTGLGLSQVFGFMQRCNGGVLARSHVGEGTEFRLLFPVKEESRQVLSTLQAEEDVAQHCILVVDDEHELRSIVCEFISTKGYKVVGAADAAEALAIMESEEICAMITNIMMPGMNGFELTKLAVEKYPALKVIMTSGYNDVVDLTIFDAQHRISFSQKPYPLQDLVQSLHSLN
ncbi:MAG: two-component system cell cycle sensor histidine kinase/response regulator CckA [Saprospiraceae bacterium]|jgi:two-component system cell cycle sensor histidine kinase/response regulator CckA